MISGVVFEYFDLGLLFEQGIYYYALEYDVFIVLKIIYDFTILLAFVI